jgi:hypothetical protein
MTTLVFLEVIDADGDLRTLWEDEKNCLTHAHLMQQGVMTYDGRPTQVKALVCVAYSQDKPNPHIHSPIAMLARWYYIPKEW